MCKPVFFEGLFGVGGKLAKKCGSWLNGVSLFFPRKKESENEKRGNWKHSRGLFILFSVFSFQLEGTGFGYFLEIENRRVKKCGVCLFFFFSPKMDMASKFVWEIKASIFLFAANNVEIFPMLHKFSVFPSFERVQN